MEQTEQTTISANDSSRERASAPLLSDDAKASARSSDDASNRTRRSFSVHVAWTVAARFLILAGGLGASIIVARVLGAEGLGALAVINVTVAVALQLGCAGLPSANTYFIARDVRELAPIWANALLFGFVAGIALGFIIVALAFLRPSLFGSVPLQLILIAAISIPFQLVTFLGLNVFLGIGRIAHFNLLDALSQSFVLINAVLVLLLLAAGLRLLIIFNTAASILMCALVILLIGRSIAVQDGARPLRPDAELFKRMARYGVKFHISVVAALLIVRADLLIVNHYRSAKEAGVYAVASQIASVLLLVPGVVATLIFPRIASVPDSRGEFTMRVTRHMALLMFGVCLAAVPLAFLLPLVYGAAFSDVPFQLLILLPGVFLLGLESVLVQHFNSMGVPKMIPAFWVAMLVLNVTFNLLFVPRFGARAAASSSSIVYALVFLFITIYFQRQTGNSLSQTFVPSAHELRGLLGRAPEISAER